MCESTDEDELMQPEAQGDDKKAQQFGKQRPKLEQFLQEFDHSVNLFNQAYRSSKAQFITDMKSFKAADIQKEDEIIERSINDSNYYYPMRRGQQQALAA